jgi:Zn finger protein HypA/HybF involved in hydrogenase expression
MKCKKCRRDMVEIGTFAFSCPNCDKDDRGGGIKIVVGPSP